MSLLEVIAFIVGPLSIAIILVVNFEMWLQENNG